MPWYKKIHIPVVWEVLNIFRICLFLSFHLSLFVIIWSFIGGFERLIPGTYFGVLLKMTFCVWRRWRISCKNKYGTHNRLVSSGTTIPPQSKKFNPVKKEYLICPFCSFRCLNEAELNRHIKSLHAPVINAKLSEVGSITHLCSTVGPV